MAGLKRDGSEFPIEFSLATWTTHDGKAAFTGIIRDISERYHAAETLRKAYAELEARVNERTADLADKNRQLRQEIAEREHTERARQHLLRELDHRVKNTLAAVQSVAMQTLRTTCSTEQFAEALLGRIGALARVHDALTRTQWDGLDIQDLVELMLKPFHCGNDRVGWRGEPLFLSASVVRSLGAALHELATNAAKYGALSEAAGHVEISWEVESSAKGRFLRIEWKESGGPPVAEPARRGTTQRLPKYAKAPTRRSPLSGYADLEMLPPALRSFPLLSKPVEVDLLVATLIEVRTKAPDQHR